MTKQILILFAMFGVLILSEGAGAQAPAVPTYHASPANSSYFGSATFNEFNWQARWGSIHMNTQADGLNDPGIRSSVSGNIPCALGGFCQDMRGEAVTNGVPELYHADRVIQPGGSDYITTHTFQGTGGTPPTMWVGIDNGIKFDIKYSFLGCMSKMMPTWAYNHTAAYSNHDVCVDVLPADPSRHTGLFNRPSTDLTHNFIYQPFYDPRSNDDRTEYTGGPGCQQQISNRCSLDGTDANVTKDIFDCKNVSGINGRPNTANELLPGYHHPIAHAFTPEEVSQIAGTSTNPSGIGERLPSTYYRYRKITQLDPLTSGHSSLPNMGTHPYVNATPTTAPAFTAYDGTTNSLNNQLAPLCAVAPATSNTTDDVVISGSNYRVICPIATGLPTPKCDCTKTAETTHPSVTTYSYQLVSSSVDAFSPIPNPVDMVPGTSSSAIRITDDSNYQHLARLKAYQINDPTNIGEDGRSFIIIDPSDFFDLKKYSDPTDPLYSFYHNSRDDSGNITAGNIMTPDTCPIGGLTNGYGGICDPTPGPSNAGCNLPIYGVGDTPTTFTAESVSYSYTDFPIKWSGYVKKWDLITPQEYLNNTSNRGNIGGGHLYLASDHINGNPVLMLTRADSYCELRERVSAQIPEVITEATPMPPIDLPCIQYFQYHFVGITTANPDGWAFMDLYNPDDVQPEARNVLYDVIHPWNINESGAADGPVLGTGSKIYISGGADRTGDSYLSFKDLTARYSDQLRHITNEPAVSVGTPVYGNFGDTNSLVAGTFLGGNSQQGAGIILNTGTSSLIRMPSPVLNNDMLCNVITYLPADAPNVFIPTNTPAEYSSFIAATTANPTLLSGLSVRDCGAIYQKNRPDSVPTAPNRTETWTGMIDCNDLVARPACNQAQMITAQRRCQLENGSIDVCGRCKNADDPDDRIVLTDATIHGAITANPSGANNPARCFYQASCFTDSDTGCPGGATSGGHVFCLAPETKITMADGSEKAIIDIKAGDEVMAFDSKNSRNIATKKAKVKATAITEKQEVLSIDDLKITPLHKVVLASGRGVMAKDVKVGDKILKRDGMVATVNKIAKNPSPITVYNLVLEDGNDGYIANGIRVLSYPILKGMKVTN